MKDDTNSPSPELLTLYPDQPHEHDVILGVHDTPSLIGHRPDEQRMTICASALQFFVPGDYGIEVADTMGQTGGYWFWDEGEKDEVIRRHSNDGEKMVLGRKHLGGIDLVMVGETPVIRIVEPEERKGNERIIEETEAIKDEEIESR